MKRPISAGFRFWRFRPRSADWRPIAVGSGQPGRWPIQSLFTQNGPHFHRPKQLCCSLELLHSMKVQSHPFHAEPPSKAPILLSPDGSTSAAVTYLRSEEHTSELQSLRHLVCRLLLEK